VARTQGAKVVDLSEYQITTPDGFIKRASDGEVVGHLSDYSGAILRSSIALREDARYDAHLANCRAWGLWVGAYHFGYSADQVNIAEQVKVQLAAAAGADLLIIDQEEQGFTDAQAQEFVDLVHAAGRVIGFYHSSCGFPGVRADFQWVADYRAASVDAGYPMKCADAVEYPGWDLWQYTSRGGDEGEGLDVNWLNPATSVASLLRLGYVTTVESDAAVAVATAPLEAQVAALTDELTVAKADAAHAEVELDQIEAQLATANASLAHFADLQRSARELLGL
jgi:hypothetical protein